MRITYADTNRRICLGKQNESKVTAVYFPLKDFREEFGNGTWTIVHRRKLSEKPYIVTDTTESGDYAVWTVTNVDTAYGGYGACELRYYVDDVLKKTLLYTTVIHPSLTRTSSTVPEPDEDLLDKVLKYFQDINEDVEKAEDYRLLSEAWAVGQKGGVDVSENDETYHNNAKYYSDITVGASGEEITADMLKTMWYNA